MSRKVIKSVTNLYDKKIERLAEVPDEKLPPLKNNKELKYIGRGISRIDGYDKVSGTAVFTFDKILKNMAHARILRCPHPHAKIRKIDITKAMNIKGVIDIITKDNTEKIDWYDGDTFIFDEHLRYQGDEIACVAAENEVIASMALKKIEVEYEILSHVTDKMTAVKEDAPKLYDWGNISPDANPAKYNRGDYEQGLKNADQIIEEEYNTQFVIHNPTEVHCSTVDWNGDHLTIWDSTQGIFAVRNSVAAALKIPQNKITVIKKYMGGGFGAKLEAGKYTVMAALLAKRIGRPVRITIDRKEMNLAVGNRPDSYQRLTVGVKNDGTLTALGMTMYGAMGAHRDGAGCQWPLRSLYKCPNVKVEEYHVAINTGRSRPFRAPGHVQGTFAFESIIDMAAEKIGMDPIEFRLKNYAEVEANWEIPWTTKLLKECYKQGAEAINWKSKRNKKAGEGKGPVKRGVGMASQIWWGTGGPPAYATVKLNRDGSVHVLSGTQDIGCGTYTILAQVAAEVLEIPVERITVSLGNTDEHPYGPSSGGSMTASSVTPAVYDGALQIKAKLMSGASALLGVREDNLVYSQGVIYSKDDKNKKKSIQEVVRETHEQILVATGARNARPQGVMLNSFGAQFAEVEVNLETGKVKVLKIVAAHDIGRTINRKLLENQFHGGIIQGIGYALLEERVIDHYTGKVLTTNLHNYKMPTIKDAPEIEVIIVSEGDDQISAIGAKGIGEPAIIPTAGAIANAVYNATGVRIRTLPITPDKILNQVYNIG
ncbi:MAG: xanthine dehydrogenase family protein molybdopterin-binding subunit [Melioribacteraceae bacterium]|nr:xanthine dehydrogenase family protein molybdopterin-binding subunit [Melioribacteraceae bacterium]